MPSHVRAAELAVLLWGLTTSLNACGTVPEVSPKYDADGHRATWLTQEREQALAVLRTDMASTRIAAAKQEAELQELRATVAQLRQENRASHQALFEAQRTIDARDTELATVKTERDTLAQVSMPRETAGATGATLQNQVTLLTDELLQVKQSLAALTARAAVTSASVDRIGGSPHQRMLAQEPTSSGFVSAMYVAPGVTDQPKGPRVTVRSGDTLARIARRYQTTVETLRRVNGLPGHRVRVGQELQLP